MKQISAFYDTEQVQVTVRGPTVEEMLDPNHEKSAVLREVEPDVRNKAENFQISIFQAAYLKMNQIKRSLQSDPQYIAKNTMLRASRNPCPVHIDQEIGYISLKDHSPFCVRCFPEHNGDGEEILTFDTAVKKMATKMINVTAQIDERIEQKKKIKRLNDEAISVIQQVRLEFIQKQGEKIKALKDYLDAIFNELVAQYDSKIEKDLLKIKGNLVKIQRQIFENETLKGQIDKFKQELKKGKRTPNLLQKLVQAGKYCTFTYYMDLGESEKLAEIDPNHYREFKPLITLYAEKEYEELMRRLALLDDSVIMPSRSATNPPKIQADPKNGSLSPPRREVKGESRRLSPEKKQREESPNKISRSFRNDSDDEKEEPGFEFHNLARRSAIVREKIVIPRWMSNKLGIYDLSAKQWHFKKLKKLDLHFLPLSCTVYTPSHDFFSLGGLNEQVPRKPSFSNQCITISLQRQVEKSMNEALHSSKSGYIKNQPPGGQNLLNSFDVTFISQRHAPMLQSRGSFPGVYVDEKIYALGGKQMMVNPISDCEAFQLKRNVWRRIASLNTGRSSACACAVSTEYIYIIGGRTSIYPSDDVSKKDALGSSIEYLNISANEWYQLRVRLPLSLEYMSCVQVSRTRIMVFGGTKIIRSQQAIRDSAEGNLGARNEIYSIEIARGKVQKVSQPEELRTQWLKGFLSVYPMFMSQDKRVHLVSEDADKNEHPKVCSFYLPELIKHIK